MAQKFKTGDIVQLKSGGPKMTVNGAELPSGAAKQYYSCQWFAGSKLEGGTFPEESLTVPAPAKEV